MCAYFCMPREEGLGMTSFLQDKQLTIALSGEIDHHSARKTMQEVEGKIDLYLPSVCVLDFRDVSFMDSSGIAIVIHTVRQMRELDGKVRLEHIPPQPMKVLKAAGVEKITQLNERSSVR